MIINPIYKQKLLDIIHHAPDGCFEVPAETSRKRILNNEEALESAAVEFQKDFEEYDCDYEWSKQEALNMLGLKHLNLIEQCDELQRTSGTYVAVIAAEYARNVEIFESVYDEENIDDYIYDDQLWSEASNAEIFIGIFHTSRQPDAEILLEIKKGAIETAISKGLCENLSIEAIKLIEI